MINALTIDLEDWFCVHYLCDFISIEDWDRHDLRVVNNTRLILDLLLKHGVKATFFVLGWVAEQVPELVCEIERQGHEIGTHGYSHTLLTNMTREDFEEDLRKAIDVTQELADQKILGFRAPAFSVTDENPWVPDVLMRNGIRYDSSVYPIGFHPDYGVSNGSLTVYQYENSLFEVPLSCAELLGRRIPCSGGAYFRIFPYRLMKYLIKKCNSQGRPVIFYIHPWEIDPGLPRIEFSRAKRLRLYTNLDKTLGKLGKLLSDFQFTSVRSMLGL